jgi:drug/metabolite transporter (DMT)-like permease
MALLVMIPGLGVILLGLAIGLRKGGLFWLLAAALVFVGGLLIWKSVKYFRQTDRPAAADLLAVFSWVSFGMGAALLKKFSLPLIDGLDRLGVGSENFDILRTVVAGVIAWTVHRILKRRLLEPAFAATALDKVVS